MRPLPSLVGLTARMRRLRSGIKSASLPKGSHGGAWQVHAWHES
jgi:hypothetical protein